MQIFAFTKFDPVKGNNSKKNTASATNSLKPFVDSAFKIKAANYRANFIPFCGGHVTKINDSHGHIVADDRFFNDQGKQISLNLEMIKTAVQPSEYSNGITVESVAVSNLDGLIPESQGAGKPRVDFVVANELMLEKCRDANISNNGTKFLPLAVCDPLCDTPDRFDAFKSFLAKNHNEVCGFKFHPTHTGKPPTDSSYLPYIDLAAKYKMPCFFHTSGETCNEGKVLASDQKVIAEFAKELYKKDPDVPVVFYHINLGGWDQYQPLMLTKELNSKKEANLYLEVSWAKTDTIIKALDMGLEDKILFGSDTPLGPMGNNKGYFQRVKEIEKAVNDHFAEEKYPKENKAQVILDKLFFKNADIVLKNKR